MNKQKDSKKGVFIFIVIVILRKALLRLGLWGKQIGGRGQRFFQLVGLGRDEHGRTRTDTGREGREGDLRSGRWRGRETGHRGVGREGDLRSRGWCGRETGQRGRGHWQASCQWHPEVAWWVVGFGRGRWRG